MQLLTLDCIFLIIWHDCVEIGFNFDINEVFL